MDVQPASSSAQSSPAFPEYFIPEQFLPVLNTVNTQVLDTGSALKHPFFHREKWLLINDSIHYSHFQKEVTNLGLNCILNIAEF